MKLKNIVYVILAVLVASFAAVQQSVAQIPCSPTALPKAALFVNWPQYQYDSGHTGCNSYESVLSTANVGNLVLDWKYATGFLASSSPAIANGILYAGSDDGSLYALNSATGALIWKYPTGGPAGMSPAVANGLVYIGAGSFVSALKASDGTLVWRYAIEGVDSWPTVADGVVYEGVNDGDLYAWNAATGALLWKFPTTHYLGYPPAVAGGRVYVGSVEPSEIGYMYALQASTGTLLWKFPLLRGADPFTPMVAGGSVYFGGSDGTFYALNAATGSLAWDDFFPGGVGGVPVMARGVVYVTSGDGNVNALQASSGVLLWKSSIGNYGASLAVANGVLYAASVDGIYALDAATGALLWSYATGNIATSPAVANGTVYIGSDDYNIYAFHLPEQ